MRDLLREKRVQGRPRRRKGAEEAPGPPAESECLEGKSTFKLYKSLKFNRVCLQTEHPESLDSGCFLYQGIPQFNCLFPVILIMCLRNLS